MSPVGLANTRISTGYAQESPRSLHHTSQVREREREREDRQLVTDEPVEFEK